MLLRYKSPVLSFGGSIHVRALASLALVLLVLMAAAPFDAAVSEAAHGGAALSAGVPREFPPQYLLDKSGKPTGFAVDVMDRVAEKAGLKVRYVVFDSWAEVYEALRAGKVDLVPNLGITDERQEYFDFTLPVETFRVSIFVRSATYTIDGVQDLPGHRVAAVEMNVGKHIVGEIRGAELVVFENVRDAVFELLAGNVDAIVYPEPVLMKLAADVRIDERIKTVGEPLLEVKRAIAVRKGDAELLERLDKAVRGFISTAEYEKVYAKWYGRPGHFWTSGRVLMVFAAMLAFAVFVGAAFRYAFVVRYNRQLRASIEERRQAEAELLKSEEKFRDLSERSVMGVYLIQDGMFKYVNPRLAEIFGYTPGEMIEKMGPRDVVLPEDWPLVEENLRRRIDGEIDSINYEFRCRKRDGKVLNIKVFGNRTSYQGRPAVLGSLLDITESKRAEEKVRRQLEHITALRTIDRAINASLDINVTLNMLLEHVISQLRVDAASVMLLNPHTQMLRCAAHRGFRTGAVSDFTMRRGEGCAGRVAMTGKPLMVPNVSERPADLEVPGLLKEEGFWAIFGVPLVSKGTVKGVLEVYSRRVFEPEPDWLNFFETLAGQAAIAIDNASMFEEITRSNLDLRMAYDATIEGWSRALDYRDKETEGHSQRVTDMTLRIAKEMGMKEDELVHVRRGALLHDIGKLGIPDHILLKPGKLTDEEWEKMKMHPTIAHKLISPIEFLRPAMDIPYCHHEKWDGTGYPNGLREEEIPLAARIFSVVDVWDALRSDRPYRPAWEKEKTRQYIKSLAGVGFDPTVVDVFFRLDW